MNLNDFLVYLMGGGAVVLMSWVSEKSPWFQKQTTDVKWWIQMIGSVIVALTAWGIVTFLPKEILNEIAPAFAVVAGIVSMFITNQLAHKADPGRK